MKNKNNSMLQNYENKFSHQLIKSAKLRVWFVIFNQNRYNHADFFHFYTLKER